MTALFILLLALICYGSFRLLLAAQEQIPGVNEPKTYISKGRRYHK